MLGTGKDVVANLTLLPIYAPFLQSSLLQRVEEAMTSSEDAHQVTALTPLRVGYPKHLRGCLRCWEDDRKAGRERYWRRSHQAPGALVCYLHGDPLIESSVQTLNRASVQELVTADEAAEGKMKPLQVGKYKHETLMLVAQGMHWLLNENTLRPGPLNLSVAYRDALDELDEGLVCGQRTRMRKICRFVDAEVGKPLLAEWNSALSDSEFNWLGGLLRPSRCSRGGQAPLRHLILMAAMGHDAESFFAAMSAPRLSDTIVAVEKRMGPKPEKPSVCEAHRKNIEVWWGDENVSVSEMGRRIGVATDSVRLFAGKIGLTFPRRCKLGVVSRPSIRIRQPRTNREEQRAAYLRALVRYPENTQSEIAGKTGGLVKWLQKHDAQWLRQHRPAVRRKVGSPGLDWERRDQECAERIPKVIKALENRGVRLSLSSIGRELRINLANAHHYLTRTSDLCASILLMRSTRS